MRTWLGWLIASQYFQILPTWIWELLVVAGILTALAYLGLLLGGTYLAQVLAGLACLTAFACIQVQDRVAEVARTAPVPAACQEQLLVYQTLREWMWICLNLYLGLYPALGFSAVVLLYGPYRLLYRTWRPRSR